MRFCAVVFALVLGLCLPWQAALALDKDGLVLYLPFDEGSGDTAGDVSGNGNDGALLGDAEWVEGQVGGGIYLAATADLVEVADSPTLDIEESLTLAIWANIEAMPDGSCALFQKPTAYMMHTTNGGDGCKMDPLVFIGGSYGAWPTPVTVSAPLLEWHHYAAAYDGTKYDLFIDGELIDSYDRQSGGAIDQDDNPLAIGRDNRGCCTARNMPCTIDEAQVWNRALTEDELQLVMNGELLAVDAAGKLSTSWARIKQAQ